MPRSLVQMPNTVTLDNNTSVPVDIAGLAKLAASESGKVIDLTLIDDFDGHHSIRQTFWNALAGLLEIGTLSNAGAAFSPVFDYAVTDGPGFGAEAADGLALRPGLPGYVADTIRPSISGAVVGAVTAYVDVTFTEGVFSADDIDAPVDADDFVLSNFAITGGDMDALAITGATNNSDTALVGGETVIRLTLSFTGTADANGTFDIAPAAGAVADNKGNGAIETAVTGIVTSA